MKVYLVTDEDFEQLREALEVKRLRKDNVSRDLEERKGLIEVHRAFNFVVVRWYQEIQNRNKL